MVIFLWTDYYWLVSLMLRIYNNNSQTFVFLRYSKSEGFNKKAEHILKLIGFHLGS